VRPPRALSLSVAEAFPLLLSAAAVASASALLSPPDLAGEASAPLLTRAEVEYAAEARGGGGDALRALTRFPPPQDGRFSLDGKVYGQYCNLYYNRLLAVKQRLKSEAQSRWPGVPGACLELRSRSRSPHPSALGAGAG